MKYVSNSIDSYYVHIKSFLDLLQSFTEINYLSFIFRACRLKPLELKYVDDFKKIKLYRHWIDEYHNSVKLVYKTPNIIYNDLLINHPKCCTDLYYGLSINQIVKISKLCLIMIGQDEDFSKNCCLISFVGIDNYFRTYLYLYDEWQQVSSLLLDFDNLQILARNLQVKFGFYQLEFFKNTLPCQNAQAWLCSLPGSEDFYAMLKSNHIFLYDALKG